MLCLTTNGNCNGYAEYMLYCAVVHYRSEYSKCVCGHTLWVRKHIRVEVETRVLRRIVEWINKQQQHEGKNGHWISASDIVKRWWHGARAHISTFHFEWSQFSVKWIMSTHISDRFVAAGGKKILHPINSVSLASLRQDAVQFKLYRNMEPARYEMWIAIMASRGSPMIRKLIVLKKNRLQ